MNSNAHLAHPEESNSASQVTSRFSNLQNHLHRVNNRTPLKKEHKFEVKAKSKACSILH